ncbi:cilia- and flagella-associated protein HOATZ isoform X2 [Apus apus]|uniref:cilia- and flagella-associated protein HOATZ isoform X2 n=1 Tax=Apus apus TaxID=8895 RepID=UPI0021F90A94|nr:cilia- and flagella-associated protein HOATZ isoform X2 [Apus apus]
MRHQVVTSRAPRRAVCPLPSGRVRASRFLLRPEQTSWGAWDAARRHAMGTEPGRHPVAPDGPLVFAGSSPSTVGFARAFWASAALPPPLESCLGPAALPRRSAALQAPQLARKSEENSERLLEAQRREKIKEKEKYLQQARRREEILALLRKQREERIAKELISHPHKPKIKTHQESRLKVAEDDLMDQEEVKALK